MSSNRLGGGGLNTWAVRAVYSRSRVRDVMDGLCGAIMLFFWCLSVFFFFSSSFRVFHDVHASHDFYDYYHVFAMSPSFFYRGFLSSP